MSAPLSQEQVNPQQQKKQTVDPLNSGNAPKITYAGLIVIIMAFVIFFGLYIFAKKEGISTTPFNPGGDGVAKLAKFSSEEEFRSYLTKAAEVNSASGFGSLSRSLNDAALELPTAGGSPEMMAQKSPDRFSQTNVQVAGIDEPDILKTDGKNIYYSSQGYFIDMPVRPLPLMEQRSVSGSTVSEKIAPDVMPYKNLTKVIAAFPPGELKKESEIDDQGEMLLAGDNLVIFSYNKITSYNVTDPKKPVEKWELDVDQESQSSVISSRLYDGDIYVVTKNYLNDYTPCAIPLFGNGRLTISCVDIYRPEVVVPIDSVMTAMKINPASGQVEDRVSFVGSSGQSIVYMSTDYLYSTYTYSEDISVFMYKFLSTAASDLFPAGVIEKIKKINEYDISSRSKYSELEQIINQYKASLNKDERLRIENEMENRMADYSKEHGRELEKTGIVKINLKDMEVEKTASVPGYPLNQFSLDEYNSNLRIATTTGTNRGGVVNESFSDVYILNKNLEKTGEVLDLGVGERIYSVRFIGERGYVVTFKQIDPFYVLDLSDHNNPMKKGELKIPGFSSYLHPLKNDLILGVGQENGQVKLSVFDVGNPVNPIEVEKYNLNEYWTEVSNNHHAFLNDPQKQVFFIPGGQGGYVFSYADGLKLVKAVSDYSVKRALYINDYFYIVGDQKISVFSIDSWDLVKSLSFE